MHILVAMGDAASESTLLRISAMRLSTFRQDHGSSVSPSSGLTSKYRPSVRAELIVSSGIRLVKSNTRQKSSVDLAKMCSGHSSQQQIVMRISIEHTGWATALSSGIASSAHSAMQS